VFGLLQWEATYKQAETAYRKLMEAFVDINEIRVSHDREIVSVIGRNYPQIEQRVARLQEALNDLFVREYAVAMHSLVGKTKKEQRAYLDSLPGLPPYVVAQVMLLSFDGHALPVDPKLVSLLAKKEILAADTPPAQAESELLKHVKAPDAVHVHQLLQAWADSAHASRSRSRRKQSASKKKNAKKTSARSRSR
jgi:endonuclease III